MSHQAQRPSWLAVVPVAVVVLVVALVIADPLGDGPARTGTPTVPAASATSAASGTILPFAAPLSGKYAIVSASLQGVAFARESDGSRVGGIEARLGLFAISPDGTRIAYFASPSFDELWIADVAHLDRAQRALSIAPRFSGGLVWSTDGKGILFSALTRERVPGVEGQPIESTIEGLHLDANRREPFASQSNVSIRPLLWVREPKIVAGVTPAGQKGPGGYLAVSAAGGNFWSLPDATRADVEVSFPRASGDGRWVAANYRYGARTLIRVWPSEDLSRATELEAPGAEIHFASWRPGSLELAIQVGGALELWTREGARRRVADLGGRFVSAFRWDGSAVYVEALNGPGELIEIDTGRRAPLPDTFARNSALGAGGPFIAASARLE